MTHAWATPPENSRSTSEFGSPSRASAPYLSQFCVRAGLRVCVRAGLRAGFCGVANVRSIHGRRTAVVRHLTGIILGPAIVGPAIAGPAILGPGGADGLGGLGNPGDGDEALASGQVHQPDAHGLPA